MMLLVRNLADWSSADSKVARVAAPTCGGRHATEVQDLRAGPGHLLRPFLQCFGSFSGPKPAGLGPTITCEIRMHCKWPPITPASFSPWPGITGYLLAESIPTVRLVSTLTAAQINWRSSGLTTLPPGRTRCALATAVATGQALAIM